MSDTLCDCQQYLDLEMTRKLISQRIKATRTLKKRLAKLAESKDKEHRLYRCESCGQAWQASRAWNWGNELYLFRVPPIELSEWLAQPYVQPDELLIYWSVLGQFLQQPIALKDDLCRVEYCGRKAIIHSAHCLKHHVENLERTQMLPQFPSGRWFAPYERRNFEAAL